jgi:hypothetical protein
MATMGSGALAVMLVTSHRLLLDCYIAVTALLQPYEGGPLRGGREERRLALRIAGRAHWDQGPDLGDPAASLSARLGMWCCPRAGGC